MDIDSYTTDELHEIVESICCFPVSGANESKIQNLALDLIEYHELSDEQILKGIAYYVSGQGLKPNLEYDWDHRQNHFENELGY